MQSSILVLGGEGRIDPQTTVHETYATWTWLRGPSHGAIGDLDTVATSD